MYYMMEFPKEDNELTEMRVNWFLRKSFRDEWISNHQGTCPIDEFVAVFYMTCCINWKKHVPNVPENIAKTATSVDQIRKWYHEDMQTPQETAIPQLNGENTEE